MSEVIEVNEMDIICGSRDDGLSCPIALALKRATGRRYHVSLFRITPVDAEGNLQVHRAQGTSAAVRRFLNQIRIGMPVGVFSFLLLTEYPYSGSETPA